MKKFIAVLAAAAAVVFSVPAFADGNPFMDVPLGHWSYDAVRLLASRGVVSGYPDGAFKGGQPATRYEMASIVARALAAADTEKASKQDMELLKKLVMEIKDELDALGVKVDSLDKRAAVLEDSLGGWKLGGRFYFDANFAGGDSATSYTESGNDNSFEKSQFRLYLSKQISETTSFYSEWRAGNAKSGAGTSAYGDISRINIRQIWVDTVLPWDINMRVGRFFVDFERDHGLYIDNKPIFGFFRADGFEFKKSWSGFSAKAVVARNTEVDPASVYAGAPQESFSVGNNYMFYALDLTWRPSERFFLGVNGAWFVEDGGERIVDGGADYSTYSAYASYSFAPAVKLQGTYYIQDVGQGILDYPETITAFSPPSFAARGYGEATEDNPQAWRVTLDLGQELLKFTGLRFEYMSQDNTFVSYRDPYNFGGAQDAGRNATVAANMPWNDESTTMMFAYAEQKWNDKWSSYLRWQHADFDTQGIDDADGYGVGVTYQYTPAIAFRLAYDYVDYGSHGPRYTGDDHVIQFRTAINF